MWTSTFLWFSQQLSFSSIFHTFFKVSVYQKYSLQTPHECGVKSSAFLHIRKKQLKFMKRLALSPKRITECQMKLNFQRTKVNQTSHEPRENAADKILPEFFTFIHFSYSCYIVGASSPSSIRQTILQYVCLIAYADLNSVWVRARKTWCKNQIEGRYKTRVKGM